MFDPSAAYDLHFSINIPSFTVVTVLNSSATSYNNKKKIKK